MKTTIKILFKSLLLLIITAILCAYFSYVFFVGNKNLKTAFQSIPKNMLDVVILGSSHTQYGINPAILNNETNLYAYVNASACQPIEVSYQMLKETLKTQKPKVVILDVFTMLPAKEVCHANSVYKMASDEMTGMEKINTLMYIDDKDTAFNYIFNIRMYHQRWKEVNIDDFVIKNNKSNYDHFGYINLPSNDLNFRFLDIPERNSKYELDKKDIKYLKKIKELCDKKGMQLLLIKTPFDINQENLNALMSVWDLANSLNIKYIDFIEKSKDLGFAFGVDSETWHNTNWGAYKITKYLSEYLTENYKFNHIDNREININLKYLKNSTYFSLLNNLPDPYAFIKYASEFKGVVIIKYNGSNKTSITKVENELMQSLGTNNNFIWNKTLNYYAIIKSGELIAESNKEAKAVINGNSIVVNKNSVIVNDKELDDISNELTLIVADESFSWKQSMNINYASKWFWKVGCDGYVCK